MTKVRRRLQLGGLVLYLSLIVIFALKPQIDRHYQEGEVASDQYPKEGDNFKVANQARVFCLIQGKSHPYLSDTSFFSYPKNKPFETPYEEGGILICSEKVLDKYPIGAYMPKFPGGKSKAYIVESNFYKRLLGKDKIKHCLVFMCLALYLLFLLRWTKGTILISCTLFGIGLEVLQAFIGKGRDFEYLDILYNSIGVGLALLLYTYWERRER